jgi:hypothetical protein
VRYRNIEQGSLLKRMFCVYETTIWSCRALSREKNIHIRWTHNGQEEGVPDIHGLDGVCQARIEKDACKGMGVCSFRYRVRRLLTWTPGGRGGRVQSGYCRTDEHMDKADFAADTASSESVSTFTLPQSTTSFFSFPISAAFLESLE